jgi:hypothetical protein
MVTLPPIDPRAVIDRTCAWTRRLLALTQTLLPWASDVGLNTHVERAVSHAERPMERGTTVAI